MWASSVRTNTPVLKKLLMVQLLIQNKTKGIIFDNDAKGCYYRIISRTTLAALRRIGYSKNSVKMLGLLQVELEHHICTGYGLAENTFLLTTYKIMYGTGQGS
jgi:hypothetical protein